MLKKDKLSFGLILGFITPFIGLMAYYLIKFRLFTIKEFLTVLTLQKSLLTGITSICLIANAVVFTIYLNKQKDQTAKGIFLATCIYALLSMLYRWIG